MAEYGGFLFLVSEPGRAARFRHDIEAGIGFSDTVSDLDWHLEPVEVFLLSLKGDTVDYACLARPGKRVARSKTHITFSDFVEFQPEIEFHELEPTLRMLIREHISSTTGHRISPKTWEILLATLREFRPASAKELDNLEVLRLKQPEHDYGPGIEVVVEEKDAINIALRMSGFDHARYLEWRSSDQEIAPFLLGLQDGDIREDAMVQHDAQVFSDWELLKRDQVGSAVFHKGRERLTIMNVNRARIETTLGVDLFYFHHRYHSYVMVQYKRMRREGNKAWYRPTDESYGNELQRMHRFEKHLRKSMGFQGSFLDGYRLFSGFFYFKVCPPGVPDLTSPDMIPGMYMPLDFWEILVDSPDVIGPQGGLRISYDNVDRYLNNTLFINLVEAGWIGSRTVDTAVITEIIQDALAGNRSLILAALQQD